MRRLSLSLTRRINSTVGVSAGSSRVSAMRFRLGPRMFHSSLAPMRTFLETLRMIEQNRRRRLLLGDQIGDRSSSPRRGPPAGRSAPARPCALRVTAIRAGPELASCMLMFARSGLFMTVPERNLRYLIHYALLFGRCRQPLRSRPLCKRLHRLPKINGCLARRSLDLGQCRFRSRSMLVRKAEN